VTDHNDRFAGKHALVIGGSNGIGRVLAQQLALGGADITFTWFRDRAGARSLVAEIEALNRRATSLRASLTRAGSADEIVTRAVEANGAPHLIAHCAALGRVGSVVASLPKEWDAIFEINVRSFRTVMAAAQQAGSLETAVTMSSVGATKVLPGYGVIGVSKAALEALVRYLAVELAPLANVNAIRPGLVDTKSFRRLSPHPERTLAGVAAQVPMGRLLSAYDVAALAAFLLAPEARMITGQTIVIDGGGGLNAWHPPSDIGADPVVGVSL
jgi:enoyl-[acyl-carrier protein] reductase III